MNKLIFFLGLVTSVATSAQQVPQTQVTNSQMQFDHIILLQPPLSRLPISLPTFPIPVNCQCATPGGGGTDAPPQAAGPHEPFIPTSALTITGVVSNH